MLVVALVSFLLHICGVNSKHFLIATDSELGVHNTSDHRYWICPANDTRSLTYHFDKGYLYYIGSVRWPDSRPVVVRRESLDNCNTQLIISRQDDRYKQVDVDWVHERLYWRNSTTVVQSDLDGLDKRAIINIPYLRQQFPELGKSISIEKIFVDPYLRKLFMVIKYDRTSSAVIMSDLSGNDLEMFEGILPGDNYKVQIDVYRRRIYVLYKDSGKIEMYNYISDGTEVYLRKSHLNTSLPSTSSNNYQFSVKDGDIYFMDNNNLYVNQIDDCGNDVETKLLEENFPIPIRRVVPLIKPPEGPNVPNVEIICPEQNENDDSGKEREVPTTPETTTPITAPPTPPKTRPPTFRNGCILPAVNTHTVLECDSCKQNGADAAKHNQLIAVTCDPGYQLDSRPTGLVTKEFIICNNGVWEPHVPKCYKSAVESSSPDIIYDREDDKKVSTTPATILLSSATPTSSTTRPSSFSRKSCRFPLHPHNKYALHEYPTCSKSLGNEVSDNQLVEVTCAPGSQLNQGMMGSNTTAIVMCKDGLWTPDVPQCEKVINNYGNSGNSDSPLTHRLKTTIIRLFNSFTRTKNSGASTSLQTGIPTEPHILRRRSCELPINHFNKYTIPECADCKRNAGDEINHGKKIAVICDTGYQLDRWFLGPATMKVTTCKNGVWKPEVPQCYKVPKQDCVEKEGRCSFQNCCADEKTADYDPLSLHVVHAVVIRTPHF